MLSLEDIAAVRSAIEICNDSDLKRTILFPLDEVDRRSNRYASKRQWNEIVKNKATASLEKQSLPKKLEKKIMDIVPGIGMRMLTWSEHHGETVGLSRQYSNDFLNSSVFTQQGIIDNKKVAKELMIDKNLSFEQKYKIACLYCFTDDIPDLYRKMTKKEKKKFYSTSPQSIKQPELVIFWSYCQMGEVDKIRGGKTVDQYGLEKAVESGSKAAVEYFFEKTNLRREEDAIVDLAVEAVRNRITARDDAIFLRRCDCGKETWDPIDYYVDIVCFLLSKMSENQRIEFLKKDIEGVEYETDDIGDHRRSRVLDYFLNWPYQDYFMETAGLMWDFLPEQNYAVLLLKICDKIEPQKERNLMYAEEESYNYRGILMEFWCQSPERYKRYFLNNEEVIYGGIDPDDSPYHIHTGEGLLNKLLILKKFTYEDIENIQNILASAKDKEKEDIISTKNWRRFCIDMIMEQKWKVLKRFVITCFSSKEEENEFKREVSFIKESDLSVKIICNNCLNWGYDWDAAESAVKWLEFFASEEEIREFKKEFLFSNIGVEFCASLLPKLERVDYYISTWLFSRRKILKFRKHLANSVGAFNCEKLISNYLVLKTYDDRDFTIRRCTTRFYGGKWKEVEKFLTWCFPSEQEISEFKENVLFEKSGKRIHFNLIKANQWKEAETFFAWLGLSAKEIKKLKKDTLFYHDAASEMFIELMHSEDDVRFVDYGSKQEATELLLRWYLTDKETVLEFKDAFKLQHPVEDLEKYKPMFENFDLMIEQRLKDLDEEKK